MALTTDSSYHQISFKVTLCDTEGNNIEVRRFGLEPHFASNFAHLELVINSVFPSLSKNNHGGIKIWWLDSDGDKIVISSNVELDQVIRQTTNVCKLYCSTQDQEAAAPAAPTVHANVLCDGCDSEIEGKRFKCLQCPDFDLCWQCEEAGSHGHVMLCLSKPVPKAKTRSFYTFCKMARHFVKNFNVENNQQSTTEENIFHGAYAPLMEMLNIFPPFGVDVHLCDDEGLQQLARSCAQKDQSTETCAPEPVQTTASTNTEPSQESSPPTAAAREAPAPDQASGSQTLQQGQPSKMVTFADQTRVVSSSQAEQSVPLYPNLHGSTATAAPIATPAMPAATLPNIPGSVWTPPFSQQQTIRQWVGPGDLPFYPSSGIEPSPYLTSSAIRQQQFNPFMRRLYHPRSNARPMGQAPAAQTGTAIPGNLPPPLIPTPATGFPTQPAGGSAPPLAPQAPMTPQPPMTVPPPQPPVHLYTPRAPAAAPQPTPTEQRARPVGARRPVTAEDREEALLWCAVERMVEMGFSNEDGRLYHTLQLVNGNIDRAIERLTNPSFSSFLP